MYKAQFQLLTRLGSTTSLAIGNTSSREISTKMYGLHALTQCIVKIQHTQTIHTTSSMHKSFSTNLLPRINFFNNTYEKIQFHVIKKYKYRMKATILYKNVSDNLDYIGFLKDFRMADSYYSWFLITELHVWMLMAKLIQGGKPGEEMRKQLVACMWQDAEMRRKQLGSMRVSVVAPQMQTLGYQFNAAIVGYDEGLMRNDQVLAGAIWRRFFQSECNDPELIEQLVAYIRKNMNMLDNTRIEDLLQSSDVTFIDRKNVLT